MIGPDTHNREFELGGINHVALVYQAFNDVTRAAYRDRYDPMTFRSVRADG